MIRLSSTPRFCTTSAAPLRTNLSRCSRHRTSTGQTSAPIISSDSRAASRTHQSPSPSSDATRSAWSVVQFAERAHGMRADVRGGIGEQLDGAVARFVAADTAKCLDCGLSNPRVGIARELREPATRLVRRDTREQRSRPLTDDGVRVRKEAGQHVSRDLAATDRCRRPRAMLKAAATRAHGSADRPLANRVTVRAVRGRMPPRRRPHRRSRQPEGPGVAGARAARVSAATSSGATCRDR